MISDKVLYSVKDDFLEIETLGAQVEVNQAEGWIGYHNGSRGHMLKFSSIRETQDGFEAARTWWNDEKGIREDVGLVTFALVGLAEYNRRWRQRVVGQVPDFISDEDLWEYYRRLVAEKGYHY